MMKGRMGHDFKDETTANVPPVASVDAPELCALVSIDGVAITHVLPMYGIVEIGRSPDCQLVIDHLSVSRHHATLQISPLTITDEGSRNGTRVRGTPLVPRTAIPVAVGEAILLGRVTILIQHRKLVVEETPGGSGSTTDALVRQLQVECARSARSGSPFAYARVQVTRGDVWYEQLREMLRTTDVVAEDQDSFQLLLPDTSADQVAGAVSRITQLVVQCGAEANIAVARYPFDGTDRKSVV